LEYHRLQRQEGETTDLRAFGAAISPELKALAAAAG